LGEGEGSLKFNLYRGAQECYLFLSGILRKERSVLLVIGEVNLTFSRKGLTEAKRERERLRARLELTGKEVAKINAKEQGGA